jgi:hypothetical protein
LDPKDSHLDPEKALVRSRGGHAHEETGPVILASFLAGLALALGGLAYAVVRGVGLWRQAKRTGAAFAAEAAAFDERSARTERILAENERAGADLRRALERLRVSRAQLGVLTRSLEQAQARIRWLRRFLPSGP